VLLINLPLPGEGLLEQLRSIVLLN